LTNVRTFFPAVKLSGVSKHVVAQHFSSCLMSRKPLEYNAFHVRGDVGIGQSCAWWFGRSANVPFAAGFEKAVSSGFLPGLTQAASRAAQAFADFLNQAIPRDGGLPTTTIDGGSL
jgi:hypothetical protein